jgi:hypothetical protein
VLVRDLRYKKVSKDKITLKWFGLRKLVKINPGNIIAIISRLYRGKISRYYLNDLRPLFPEGA